MTIKFVGTFCFQMSQHKKKMKKKLFGQTHTRKKNAKTFSKKALHFSVDVFGFLDSIHYSFFFAETMTNNANIYFIFGERRKYVDV